MNWEAIGALGEFLAAITVIATLVYLSLQVRSVREQTSTAALQHVYNSINEYSKLIAESESLSAIIVKGRASYSSLTEEEKLRFDHVYGYFFNALESWYLQAGHTSSLREKQEVIENIKGIIEIYGRYPGVMDYWEEYKSLYTPEIRAIYEEVQNDA